MHHIGAQEWNAVNFSPELRVALEAIRNDHVHGASGLARAALDLLASELERLQGDNREPRWREQMLQLCHTIADLRPSLAPLVTLASRCAAAVQAPEPRQCAVDVVHQLQEDLANAAEQVAPQLLALLGSGAHVITLSASSMVEEVLVRCQPALAGVTLLESRPGGEGAGVAARLAARLALPVHLVPDAAMALAMESATAVVVGCDALLANGHAVNKTGTYPLALVAAAQGIPVYMLADALKIAPMSWVWHPETFDPTLVWDHPAPGVIPVAIPFELSPLHLLTMFRPAGALTSALIAQNARDLEPGYSLVR